ncbi:hypothetical protein [Parendozoicomonas haliclonae]
MSKEAGLKLVLAGLLFSSPALGDIQPLPNHQMGNMYIDNSVPLGTRQSIQNTIGDIQRQITSEVQSRDVDAAISAKIPKPEKKIELSVDERVQEALAKSHVSPLNGEVYGPFQLPSQTTYPETFTRTVNGEEVSDTIQVGGRGGGYQIGLPNSGSIEGLSGAGIRLVFPNRGNGNGGTSDLPFANQIIQAPGVPASIEVKGDQIILLISPPNQ